MNNKRKDFSWKWYLFGSIACCWILYYLYTDFDHVINLKSNDHRRGFLQSFMKLLSLLGGEYLVYIFLLMLIVFLLYAAYKDYQKEKNAKGQKVESFSKDDKEMVESIVGRWKYSGLMVDEIKSSNADVKDKIEAFIKKTVESDFGGLTYIFSADNTFSLIDASNLDLPINGLYTFKDGKLKIVREKGDYDVYDASLDDGKLHIYEDYLDMLKSLELVEFAELGIDDLSLKFYKATVKLTFTKQ